VALNHGIVLVNVDTPWPSWALWAHEIGHALFLRHNDTVSGASVPEDHDQEDACVMGYPTFEDDSEFVATYCGKCNLKLRGVNIRAKRAGKHILPANHRG
jgi:hypothetical protein